MTMKKMNLRPLFMLGMLVLLILSGCAEGKKTEDTVTDDTQNNHTETVLPEKTEELQETVQKPEVGEQTLMVSTEPKKKTYYMEDGKVYLNLQYCDVSVEGTGYENLKRNLEKWSLERSEQFRNVDPALEEQAKKEDAASFYGYSEYQTVASKRIDEQVVSMLEICSYDLGDAMKDYAYYMNGTAGFYEVQGINFDTQTGKQLELADILTDYDNFLSEVRARAKEELSENYKEGLFEDYEERLDTMWTVGDPVWYMDASGIVIVLQPGAVGYLDIGFPQIHMSYTEFGHYIKQSYLPEDGRDGVAAFEENQELLLNLSGVEQPVSLKLIGVANEDEKNYTLQLGDQKIPIAEYVRLMDAYLVKKDGEIYCMIQMDLASDDYDTFIFRLTDGKLEKIQEIYAAIDTGNINTKQIKMNETIYFLGTYGGEKIYYFNEEGEFVTDDQEYLLSRNDFVLTTMVELPVILEGNENILPSGSHIILDATDGETYVTFTIQETGQKGEISVSRSEDGFYLTIHGMSEYDCFETLPYAG